MAKIPCQNALYLHLLDESVTSLFIPLFQLISSQQSFLKPLMDSPMWVNDLELQAYHCQPIRPLNNPSNPASLKNFTSLTLSSQSIEMSQAVQKIKQESHS